MVATVNGDEPLYSFMLDQLKLVDRFYVIRNLNNLFGLDCHKVGCIKMKKQDRKRK